MDKFDFVIDGFENENSEIFDVRLYCIVGDDLEVEITRAEQWQAVPSRWLEWSKDEWFKHNAWLLEKAEAEYKNMLEEWS